MKDKDYVRIVEDTTKEVKNTYMMRTNEENNEEDFTVPDELVQLKIKDHFLETLLMMLRGNSIQYSSGKKKGHKRKKLELENEIKTLE